MSTTPFMDPDSLIFCRAVAKLAFCNPFLPERVQCEQAILGSRYKDHGPVWYARNTLLRNPNIQEIQAMANQQAERLREKLIDGIVPSPEEATLYRDLVLYFLYHRYEPQFESFLRGSRSGKVIWYRAFRQDIGYFLETTGMLEAQLPPEVIFACYFQVRRSFELIFSFIIGRSMAAAELRGRIWQSIFTHNMRRYRLGLYQRMGDITTLITGPSGTGKELVAQAVGMTRFIPFDAESLRFGTDFQRSFFALNLSALSPTLVESELFGHRRGSFTGAAGDRAGWLETCPSLGTVFLDEIGELETSLQVKLLRVLQGRTFQRLGETETRHFSGKIVAATNRNLAEEMAAGRFREDFYYRLCADQIQTPSLASQLSGPGDELPHLVGHIANQVAGPELGPQITDEAVTWIRKNLPKTYTWPGNFRELEQCVRNIMIGGSYQPRTTTSDTSNSWRLAQQGRLSADALLAFYCQQVYQQLGSYTATADALGLDRRTVKAKVTAAEQTQE